MLANNQLFISTDEKIDLSTYVVIPIDSLKNPEEHSNLKVIQNIFIEQLPDGSICLVEANEDKQTDVQEQSPIAFSTTASKINIDITQKTLSTPIKNRTILLQPPSKKQNQEKPMLQTSSLKKLASKQLEQKFKCIKCDNLFDTLLLYRDHMKWHRCQKKFKCTKCSSGYNVENNLKIHMLLTHADESNTQCPICNVNLTFQRAAGLKSHLMLHQVEEFYTCEECDGEFDKEDDFIKHMETHATIKRYAPKPLTCSYCKVKFEDFKELRAHVSDHVKLKKAFYKAKRPRKSGIKKDNNHVCSVCNKSFIKNSLLERHERIHSGERPFKCEFCDRGFTQKGTLQIHLSRHTGIKPFSCTLCPAKFNQKGNLRVHIQKTHTFPSEDQKMYKCSQCTCIFKKIATLNGHVTKAHLNVKEPETQDTIIDKVMLNLKQLEKQTSANPAEEETADKNKDKELQEQIVVENKLEEVAPDFLKSHYVQLTECVADGNVRKYVVRQKKIDDVRWYFCNYCSKQFKKPSDLIRHIRVHTREKPFKCKQCKTAFSLKSTLISHMKTHRSKLDYRCRVCGSQFSSLRVLNSHLRKHDFESLPKWQCITCGFLFDELEKGYKHREDKGSERPHIIQPFIHRILKQPLYQTTYGSLTFKPPKTRFPNTGAESPTTRPFHCGICDARFTRRVNLKRHIQYHTGDRKFKCHICPKSFITSYRLTEHLNYHNNIKKHICKVCSKRFVTASLLKRHLIIHNTHRPYQCPYCDKTFKTLLLCRSHIRQVHKRDVIPKFNSQSFTSNVIPEDQKPQITTEFISRQNAEGAVSALQDVQELLPQQDLRLSPSPSPPPPPASENVVIQQYLPVSQNSMAVLGSNDIQDPTNYQTIYVSISDLSFLDNSNLNLTSTSLAPQLKLENTDSLLLNDIEESNIIFDIASLKPELDLPPVEIFKDISDENDVSTTTTTLPSIAEISTKTIKLNSFSEKNFTGKSRNSNPLLGSNPSLYPNVTFADELSLPISVVEGCNVFDASTPTTIFQSTDSADLSQTDNIYKFTNIMCINCNKVFASLDVFQDHSCSLLGDQTVQARNEAVVDCEEISGNENENVENSGQDVNDPEIGGKVKGAFECRICKKLLANKFSLDRHVNSHSSKANFECSHCEKVINGRNLYEKHLASHTESNGSLLKSCKYCDKEFKKPSDLKRHLRTHTGEKPFGCHLCHKNFSLKSTLESHIKTHDPSPKRYSCTICNSFFSSKSSLKVHMTIHTGQKPHACLFCDQKFRTASNRKSHEILMHLSKSKKSAEGKQARITGMLESVASEVLHNVNNSHEESVPVDNSKEVAKESISSEETPSHVVNLIAPPENLLPNLPEDQIPIDLLQQLQMSGVILTNENEPLILNDITLLNVENSKDNVQVISLPPAETKINIAVSDDNLVKTEKIKNIECDICHKMYTSKDVLRRHKKNIHGLNKKFPCIKCDKGFDTQDELSKHVKLHSGYRPFSCLHCANSFTEEQSLKTHMKRIHQQVNTVKETTSALLNMKFDLPSSANIDDPLFNNLFVKKDSIILLD